MNPLSFAVVLGLLLGTWAQMNVVRPLCDSPEAEEAAVVAQDYLNAQHNHGYRYALNRIEDIKIYTGINGEDMYQMEVDLLETNCHVLDPTPLANCTVRPKIMTAVEGDCDVVLKKVGGVLSVTAFKCKTEESTEDMCVGCYRLLPLNDTAALDFVQASLITLNNNTVNMSYAMVEVGRMSSQLFRDGPNYLVEYVVVEANCTDVACVPLDDPMVERGICTASGSGASHNINCNMFPVAMVPVVDANNTAVAGPAPPAVHVHTGNLPHRHGLSHHKLTSFHNPQMSGLLSAESAESAEDVPVAPAVAAADPAPAAADPAPAAADPAPAAADPAPAAADPAPAAVDPAPAVVDVALEDSVSADFSTSKEIPPFLIFKRDVAAATAVAADAAVPQMLVPVCPGKYRYFS